MALNQLCGRRRSDATFHPVLPWIIDFRFDPRSNPTSGLQQLSFFKKISFRIYSWRDLSKSKCRLMKVYRVVSLFCIIITVLHS